MGFCFDRSGVRVPAIAISAWIPDRTVVTDEYRSTSVIRTIRERWSLGAPLTGRDAAARDLSPVFTLDTPRAPESWPEASPRPVPAFTQPVVPHEARLLALPRHIVFGLLALGKTLGVDTPEIDKDADISGGEGLEIASDLFGHLFPRLQL
jgi:phospholipase C